MTSKVDRTEYARVDALIEKGKKTAKEVEGMKQLASEIQYAIVTRKLRPGKCD